MSFLNKFIDKAKSRHQSDSASTKEVKLNETTNHIHTDNHTHSKTSSLQDEEVHGTLK